MTFMRFSSARDRAPGGLDGRGAVARGAVPFGLVLLLVLGGCAGSARRVSLDAGHRGEASLALDAAALAGGERQRVTVRLARPAALDLRLPFEEAPFNGAQVNASVNGRRLPPYHAFGGDTRYDAVRGRPGMHPPVADIEARWLVAPDALRAGDNEVVIWTSGVRADPALAELGPAPRLRATPLRLGLADGAELPRYANSVHYDFGVWPQGYDYGEDADRRHKRDLALLGVLNGKGMAQVVVPLGGTEASLWGVKRACEDNALRWGFGHQEFYTIWELCGNPRLWARFVDVDGNPETQSKFHGQTIFPHVLAATPEARGADVVLYDVDRYRRTLEPAIRVLAPYTDYYNFKCEQHGPWGQGFDDDGERWAAQGLHGDAWARNFYEACKAANDLVRAHDPGGRVQEMNHWLPPIRSVLFDTALARGQPMGDMIGALMTHFCNLASFDVDAQGRMVPGDTLERQYPGGRFPAERGTWPDHLVARGFRVVDDIAYPETALDFNRYRLGRSERDLLPGLDPAEHRWGNGKPFDYRAGFRGDEAMYNSENGEWVGYSAPAPYQFLQGFFAYSLLPTGASEPRDLRMTTRQGLTATTDLHVNLYGKWVEGAGHIKRLRTADPLYGDLFGWTGNEHCNMGDYIRMVGIKDPHHRLPPHDAFGLVRRTCYAFVTEGPIIPAYLNDDDTAEMFVKCVAQTLDGQRYIGVYAANFDGKPHKLDVTLPIRTERPIDAMVFDDRAWDWKSAKPWRIEPGESVRYRAEVPGLGAWLVLIPMPEGGVSRALGLGEPPRPEAPGADEAIDAARPVLRWDPGAARANARYQVEVAREALFRPQDRVELSAPFAGGAYTLATTPAPAWRYFWRVRAVGRDGRGGEWSEPRAFVYKWPEYAKAFPASPVSAPPAAAVPKPETPAWQKLADEHGLEAADNLAARGEIFATGGRMKSPSRAVDGQAYSWWTNGDDEGNSKFPLPAEWAVIWREPVRVSRVDILWAETPAPREFIVEASGDAQNWTELHRGKGGEPLTTLRPPAAVEARFVRIRFPAPDAATTNGEVGIREIVIR